MSFQAYAYILHGSGGQYGEAVPEWRLDDRERGPGMGGFWISLGVVLSVGVGLAAADPFIRGPDAGPRPTFEFVEHVTGGADNSDSLPMVVALHYMTGTPQTSARDYGDLDFPARVILVAGKTPLGNGFSFFSADYYDQPMDFQEREALSVASELADLIKDLRETRPTKGRTMVTGFSQGGDLSYLLALRYPRLMGGALPMGARLLSGWRSATKLPGVAAPRVEVFHGESDSIVPIAQAMDAVEFLNTIGIPATLHAYPETDHQYPEEMKRDYESILAELVHSIH